MSTSRTVSRVLQSRPTIEGAGVHLKRAFGYHESPLLDPFLLLDDFHSDNPDHYRAGFPWHPHRGIETVTYMLHGNFRHGDSIGNSGVIGSGDVQWMTAGGGIVHQEIPAQEVGLLWGFQLWTNLPASHKMMEPRYQEFQSEEIPTVTLDTGARVRVICGSVNGTEGPVKDIVTDPEYLDVTVPSGGRFTHAVDDSHRVVAYVLEGRGRFDAHTAYGPEHLVILEKGDGVEVRTDGEMVRFLLISGRPIGEPVAWRGPIVMNTREELDRAFREYRDGTFLKHR
jgi:redox-sensitive bicupin YhaK (pirin superfamily)